MNGEYERGWTDHQRGRRCDLSQPAEYVRGWIAREDEDRKAAMSNDKNPTQTTERATKAEVVGRLSDVAESMTFALNAMTRRYGDSEHVRQIELARHALGLPNDDEEAAAAMQPNRWQG